MHRIEPAKLRPGVTLDDLPKAMKANAEMGTRVLRGKALIFWDPERPGKKRDAIDTDQITPSDDCISESLDRLDERWKAGAFRYLMPDFRERVHRGETFVIAGDRFAIGSSREMSPAGLKAVGEEAGGELVIVCGNNMGDIFRRNALNLGLHVVQAPDAVEDARDGDVMELRESVTRPPRIEWADASTARGLTTTEQIVWAHRVDKEADVRPGATLRIYADLLPASDGTAPFSIHTFDTITGGTISPRQIAIANDHFVFSGREMDEKQTSIGRQFAEKHGIRRPYYATPGDGIFHFYFPEQGLVMPGAFIPGADSHSRAYGAYGAVGMGVGSTALGFGWSTGYIFFTLAKARRVTFRGKLQPWVSGKDVVLALLRRWGKEQSHGMSVEFIDADRQLPIPFRNTVANMMAEAEAQNGIFAADDITYEWYRKRGMTDLPYPRIAPGADARYEIDEELDLAEVIPFIAKPFAPGNAFPAGEVARERITFDKAYIGSCTNGGYDDLLEAALVIFEAKKKGATRAATDLVIFPGSGQVKEQIEGGDPRLGGESIAEVFRSVGGEIRQSWCGPCFGQGPDALHKGEVAITSFNRNWQNRMGLGGLGYLASPAVVAASALLGYMGPPDELGLRWDAERFGNIAA